MSKFKLVFIVAFLTILNLKCYGQENNDWPTIPGFKPNSPLTLTSTETFIGFTAAAGLSYILAEYVLKDEENINYYTLRAGMNDEYQHALKSVWHQGFGLEHRVASWFSLLGEINLQQWEDRTTGINDNEKFGIGAGAKMYFRWYLFGKKRISPYLEYGTGVFYGFKKFPYNGTNFTFNHSSLLGVEYTIKNGNKVRLGYGNFHQSNNGWIGNSNPGYDGNGFSISYSWVIKKKLKNDNSKEKSY